MQGGKERQVGRNELSKTLKAVTRDWGAAIACGCAVKMIDRFTKWKLPAREQKTAPWLLLGLFSCSALPWADVYSWHSQCLRQDACIKSEILVARAGMVKHTAVVRHVATLWAFSIFAQLHFHCRVRAGISCRRQVGRDSSTRGFLAVNILAYSGILHTASHELASSWPAATVRLNSTERYMRDARVQ